MAKVLIRELDEEVVDKLKARAKRHRRSLESELRGILEHAAAADFASAQSVAAELRRRLAGRSHSDSTAAIAEDRAR